LNTHLAPEERTHLASEERTKEILTQLKKRLTHLGEKIVFIVGNMYKSICCLKPAATGAIEIRQLDIWTPFLITAGLNK
jgi:soluble P-type ATPase